MEICQTNIQLQIHGKDVGQIQLERGIIEGLPTSSLLLGVFLTLFWENIRASEDYKRLCFRFPAGF